MANREQKITFGEMRESGVRSIARVAIYPIRDVEKRAGELSTIDLISDRSRLALHSVHRGGRGWGR